MSGRYKFVCGLQMSDGGPGTEALPRLPYDAVFRIEVSLSSQTTSAIVMRTTARLYCLEGAQRNRPSAGDAEWRSLAYGAPCIQLVQHENENLEQSAAFTIRIVIAEVESGIALWEAVVDGNCHYGAMQSNFHTFVSAGNTYAIQFVSEEEAGRMMESVKDLLSQQQQQTTEQQALHDPTEQPVVFRKPTKPPRRLNKKDISSPCNFKHVSGITMQRTSTCEQELRGTIQRKIRSLSLSNLSRQNKTGEDIPVVEEKAVGRRLSRKVKSLKRKSAYSANESPDSVNVSSMKRADPQRMSLPSHFRARQRPTITPTSFIPHTAHSQLNRTLSQSSGDIPSTTPNPASLKPHPSGAIEQRHTMKETSPNHRPINTATMPSMTVPSDGTLNSIPYRPSPSPVTDTGGQMMQRVAIASSDVIGWTPDGRLIVQMPVLPVGQGLAGQQTRPGQGLAGQTRLGQGPRPAPIRRASTGQFTTERKLSSEVLSTKPPSDPPRKQLSVANRPLPPTPLDIAMPQSQALHSRPHTVPHGNKTERDPDTSVLNGLPVASHSVSNPPTSSPTPPPSGTNMEPPRSTNHQHTNSMDGTLQDVTDQMSRALAQFDDLLGVAQTSL